jgi:hypothetical protein
VTNDPVAVVVPTGGAPVTQVFDIDVDIGATTATIIITANAGGTEDISDRSLSCSNTGSVGVQSFSNVAITSVVVSGSNGPGPYVAGMNFTVNVTYSNTGGTNADANATLSFGTYTFLTPNNPGVVTVGVGTSASQVFTVSVSESAVTWNNVPIDVQAVCIEDITNTVSTTSTISTTVSIREHSTVAITAITLTTGNGNYTVDSTFTLEVRFDNTGDTAATVDAVLGFGSYMDLSQNNPAAVFVAAGGWTIQAFIVTVSPTAALDTVTINATWTGTEAISNVGISGNATIYAINVTIKEQIDIVSWSLDIIYSYNGSSLLNVTGALIGASDSINVSVEMTTPGMEIYMFIIAGDDGSINFTSWTQFAEIATNTYGLTMSLASILSDDPLKSQNRWLNVTLVYRDSGIDTPFLLVGNAAFLVPRPMDIEAAWLEGTTIDVNATVPDFDVEAIEVSLVQATFDESLVTVESARLLLVGTASPAILAQLNMVFSGGRWNAQVSKDTPGIAAIWQAGKAAGTVFAYFQVMDALGNQHATIKDISGNYLMFGIQLNVIDTHAKVANVTNIVTLATGSQSSPLIPTEIYPLRITVPLIRGQAFVRTVALYYSTTLPASNTKAGWEAVNASVLKFSLIDVTTFEWMVMFPPQAAGSEIYWAVYVLDYAGNDNAANMTTSVATLVYQALPPTAALEEPVGFALAGLMLFGLIFAISYRVQQGVQAVKKAKKVSAAKAAPESKTIGGTGKKTPLSKDIPTKACPVCKAKVGADLDECPYCHKKF